MTGRELIVYILTNHLEDEPVFKDGKFIGFITTQEAAAKLEVGKGTILAMVQLGQLEAERVTETLLIPANHIRLTKGVTNNG